MNFINSFDKTKILIQTDKKNHRIRYNCFNILAFKVTEVYSPFGIEKYNNKDILNLELTNNSNLKNNLISIIKELDTYFKELSETHEDFHGLNYTSPIKNKDDKTIIIRTHISNKLKIKTKKETPTDIKIKNNTFNIGLEFSNIWTYGENYGLVLTTNIIDLT
jgi:hypothetical protein